MLSRRRWAVLAVAALCVVCCKIWLAAGQKDKQQEWYEKSLPLEASLDARLAAWKGAPLDDYDGFIAQSCRTCQGYRATFGSLNAHESAWNESLSDPTFIQRYRETAIDWISEKQRNGLLSFTGNTKTQGVIYTAHDQSSVNSAIASIHYLRNRLNCAAPVELWSFDAESFVVDNDWASARNVRLRSSTAPRNADGTNRDYSIKIRAILESDFAKVLLLDADCIPLVDPFGDSGVMHSRGLKNYGIMMWSNVWDLSPYMPIWQIVGHHCRKEFMGESGVFAIDKTRHLDILHLSLFLATRRGAWRQQFYGDCDTFRFAALALRKDWAIPSRHTGLVSNDGLHSCGHSFLHYDQSGVPAFLHFIGLKHLTELGYVLDGEEAFFGKVQAAGSKVKSEAISANDLLYGQSRSLRKRAASEANLHYSTQTQATSLKPGFCLEVNLPSSPWPEGMIIQGHLQKTLLKA